MKKLLLAFFLGTTLLASGKDLTCKDYFKKEVYITMRDGVELYTAIYTPKDTSIDYPILLKRTTYGCKPYGTNNIPKKIAYNTDLVAKGYIFVSQDMRGRWMSGGVFENTKPPYSWADKSKTDETTDAWDTLEWLTKNIEHFNGNIGVYGNSYLGWSALTTAAANHPAVKAVIAMAPVTDFFFEDFTRYGLVSVNYAPFLNTFGVAKDKPTTNSWYSTSPRDYVSDADRHLKYDYYSYYLDKFTLRNIEKALISPKNSFWKKIMAHNVYYDDYRQKHDWLHYLNNINCPVMITAGWNDEQNLYGALNSFKTIDKNSPNAQVKLVMGPWAHSHPKERKEKYRLGDIFYGYNLSRDYQRNIEVPYFEYYLKGIGKPPGFKARIFDTGSKQWEETLANPLYPADRQTAFYLDASGVLSRTKDHPEEYGSYVSDPFHPVPVIEDDDFHYLAPKYYMTADQRFASKRPDVLTYRSEPLDSDMTVLGEPKAFITFSTDHTAADIYVKIIDLYPMDRKPEKEDKPDKKMNGYQQLVRMGYIRGRFRDSFSNPKPFEKGVKYTVQVPLLEMFHTFKKGHRIMVQIQSSSFPLFDINPQNYIENVYDACRKDFSSATHKVYADSKIILPLK